MQHNELNTTKRGRRSPVVLGILLLTATVAGCGFVRPIANHQDDASRHRSQIHPATTLTGEAYDDAEKTLLRRIAKLAGNAGVTRVHGEGIEPFFLLEIQSVATPRLDARAIHRGEVSLAVVKASSKIGETLPAKVPQLEPMRVQRAYQDGVDTSASGNPAVEFAFGDRDAGFLQAVRPGADEKVAVAIDGVIVLLVDVRSQILDGRFQIESATNPGEIRLIAALLEEGPLPTDFVAEDPSDIEFE